MKFSLSCSLRSAVVLGLFLLSGCVTVDQQKQAGNSAAPVNVTPSLDTPVTSITAGYKDDAPCPSPPTAEELNAIPEAQPVAETLKRGPNNPYVVTVQGASRRYVPETANRSFVQEGKASWYGCKFHGKFTSSGESYDVYKMTAAHPTLPIPSYVRVTNLENNRSLVLRVNDRGPFIDGRVIDVSYVAAYRLGILKTGTASVRVERILPGVDTGTSETETRDDAAQVTMVSSLTRPTSLAVGAGVGGGAGANNGDGAAQMVNGTKSNASPPAAAPIAVPKPAAVATASETKPLPVPVVPAKDGKKIFLQLGAFASAESARNERDYFQGLKVSSYPVNFIANGGLFKVIVGPFNKSDDAQKEKKALMDKGINSFVVTY